VGSKGEGALDRAADALVARLVELVHEGCFPSKDDTEHHLDFGDAAILCRASTSFAAYENALEHAGVPFLTVAGRGFYDRPEIRDLLNALQALADPADDLALAGLLRSPALGLSDLALYHLCEARDHAIASHPTGRPRSLWESLADEASALARLSSRDQAHAQRARRTIQRLHRQIGRASVAEILKQFLDETGYQAALLAADQPRAVRNVKKLLADAHNSGLVGVGDFLEYINGLRDTGAREAESRAIGEGAVQIMSVHAAKGLEFAIVAIGDVTHSSHVTQGTLIDHDLGVVPSPQTRDEQTSAFHELSRERASDEEDAEADRLLYVAATRAREKLLLNGCIRLRKGDRTPAGLRGWLGKLASAEALDLGDVDFTAYDEEGEGMLCRTLSAGGEDVACALYEPAFSPPTRAVSQNDGETAGRLLLPPPLLAPIVKDEMVEATPEQTPPQRVWRVVPSVKRPSAPSWVVGSVVHKALATWRFPDSSFDAWTAARGRQYGIVNQDALRDLSRRSRRLLDRFRDHGLYTHMATAERRFHEVPYSIHVDGRLESGVIDALYRRDSDWIIVEFKTDDVRDAGSLQRLLTATDYVAQAERYVAAAQHLLGQRPRALLCMLDYEGGVLLEDWRDLLHREQAQRQLRNHGQSDLPQQERDQRSDISER
jgi:ATP-dependent exoDNAse (exonuclease V) beta subunit